MSAISPFFTTNSQRLAKLSDKYFEKFSHLILGVKSITAIDTTNTSTIDLDGICISNTANIFVERDVIDRDEDVEVSRITNCTTASMLSHEISIDFSTESMLRGSNGLDPVSNLPTQSGIVESIPNEQNFIADGHIRLVKNENIVLSGDFINAITKNLDGDMEAGVKRKPESESISLFAPSPKKIMLENHEAEHVALTTDFVKIDNQEKINIISTAKPQEINVELLIAKGDAGHLGLPLASEISGSLGSSLTLSASPMPPAPQIIIKKNSIMSDTASALEFLRRGMMAEKAKRKNFQNKTSSGTRVGSSGEYASSDLQIQTFSVHTIMEPVIEENVNDIEEIGSQLKFVKEAEEIGAGSKVAGKLKYKVSEIPSFKKSLPSVADYVDKEKKVELEKIDEPADVYLTSIQESEQTILSHQSETLYNHGPTDSIYVFV